MKNQVQLRTVDGRTGLAGEVGCHLNRLEEVVERLKTALAVQTVGSVMMTGSFEVSAAAVRQLIRHRRARDGIFGLNLFCDPAWDILLEAFAAHLGQHKISVSGLCYASGAPQTTALRWIKLLEKEGFLGRRNDPQDARRSWVELTETGVTAMYRYFAGVHGDMPAF